MNNQNKYAYFFIGLLSLAVLSFLTWLIYMREPIAGYPSWVTALPYSNAFLNSLTSALLIWGYVEIKKNKNESAHKKLMISATLTSGLFLVSYVLYHHFHGDTKFLGQGVIRPIYFFILISHIGLSLPLVPMVFATLWHASREQWQSHKKIACWTFPIWLYVSVTGVLIFIFIKSFN